VCGLAFVLPVGLLGCDASEGAGGGSDGMKGTTGGSSGGTGTTMEPCELPQDEAAPATGATITIRNETSVVQYVLPNIGSCESQQLVLGVDGLGTNLPYEGQPIDGCRSPSLCNIGCSDGSYPGIALAPGASTEVPWDGRVWIEDPIPAACGDEDVCGPDAPVGSSAPFRCRRATSVQGMGFTVTARITSQCDPNDTAIVECDCPSGACPISVYDLEAPTPERQVSASGTFPEDVVIVID